MNNLRPGSEYDNLYLAALCRSKADWLVGINATRLFSVLYHRTLNVGRVVSPTLAMLVQREAQIRAFQSEPFYKISLGFGDFKAESERFSDKEEAISAAKLCEADTAAVEKVERREKSENPPTLYDLTTLQRDANRILGYTAQQTLDYLQSLYEKKLCTYPRTDSKFLTDNMMPTVSDIVSVSADILCVQKPSTINADKVCDSKKVSDHHAVIPTKSAKNADINALLAGEREILKLIAGRTLCAVSNPHIYEETAAVIFCGGREFTVKRKSVISDGWRAYLKSDETEDAPIELVEGQILKEKTVSVTEGKTTPPKRFTEDTILAAMENAGKEDIPENAERKGLGTPATRAGIIEKLVSVGFAVRKKEQKSVFIVPDGIGASRITVLPEELQSPILTAEWERQFLLIEKGELSAEEFMSAIEDMVKNLVRDYKAMDGAEVFFPSGRAVVGKCPRC